jgi:hypothetical protein
VRIPVCAEFKLVVCKVGGCCGKYLLSPAGGYQTLRIEAWHSGVIVLFSVEVQVLLPVHVPFDRIHSALVSLL